MSDGAWLASVWAAMVALVVGIAVGVAVLDNHSGHVSCLRLHEVSQLETRYVRSGLEGECYIKVDQQWVPENRWRTFEGE